MHLVRVVWYVWYVCKCFNGLLDIHFPVLNLNFPKRWLTLRRRVYAIRDQPQVQNIPKCKNLMCKIWPYLTSSPRHFRQHFTAANCSDGRWVSCSQPKIIQNHSESVASCGFKYKSTTENDVNIFFFHSGIIEIPGARAALGRHIRSLCWPSSIRLGALRAGSTERAGHGNSRVFSASSRSVIHPILMVHGGS